MSKIFENIIADKLSSLFKNVLANEQHGFISGRFITNLLLYHDYLNTTMEESIQIGATYTDFTKAFDIVNHSILLNKLLSFGVGDPLLNWSSFITNKKQLIRFNNSFPRNIDVPSEVP